MKESMARDISSAAIKEAVGIENPVSLEMVKMLKSYTNARLGIGRAGDRMRTASLLKFRADHAVAQDAVWTPMEEKVVDALGFYKIQTLVQEKEEYVRRPDQGRLISEETAAALREHCKPGADVQLLAADGLSGFAVNANLRPMYHALVKGCEERGWSFGTPVFIRYGRVNVADKVSEALDIPKVTILLIGERPGLATGESMSVYMGYQSSSAKPESHRNVISNIYAEGTPPREAAEQVLELAELYMKEKKSGVELNYSIS